MINVSDKITIEIHWTHQGLLEKESLSPSDADEDILESLWAKDVICTPSIMISGDVFSGHYADSDIPRQFALK